MRRIRDGETFNSDELELGEVELEKPEPRPESHMTMEPWCLLEDAPVEIQRWAWERLYGNQ